MVLYKCVLNKHTVFGICSNPCVDLLIRESTIYWTPTAVLTSNSFLSMKISLLSVTTNWRQPGFQISSAFYWLWLTASCSKDLQPVSLTIFCKRSFRNPLCN